MTDITQMAKAVQDAGADAVSLINTLIGMAIEDGYIDSVDQPVLDFFPDRRFLQVL